MYSELNEMYFFTILKIQHKATRKKINRQSEQAFAIFLNLSFRIAHLKSCRAVQNYISGKFISLYTFFRREAFPEKFARSREAHLVSSGLPSKNKTGTFPRTSENLSKFPNLVFRPQFHPFPDVWLVLKETSWGKRRWPGKSAKCIFHGGSFSLFTSVLYRVKNNCHLRLLNKQWLGIYGRGRQ